MRYVVTKITYENRSGQPTYFSIRDDRSRMPDIAASAYLIYLRDEKGRSQTTCRNYADSIASFLNAVAASPTVKGDWKRIKPQHLAAYHRERATELKESSLDQIVSRLKGFLEWSYESGWIDKPILYSWILPFEEERKMKIHRAEKKSKDPFNLWGQYIPEYDFKYALTFSPRKKTWERTRDEIILKLGYYSGLRRSETVDPNNISLKRVKKAIAAAHPDGGFELSIIGKGKNGGKVRKIYIPPHLARQIKAFINNELKRQTPDATLLIGKRSGTKTLCLNVQHAGLTFTEITNAIRENGDMEKAIVWLDEGTKRSFHSLRHSYATNFGDLVNAKIEEKTLLQERMGHAHEETTDVYLWFSAKKAGDEKTASRYVSSLKKAAREFGTEESDEDVAT